MTNRLSTALLLAMIMMVIITACSSAASSTTAAPAATTSQDGATLVQERCTRCHPLDRVESSKHTASEWKAIVDMMISRGAQLTSGEETAVVDYLAANFGK
jgi:cytochrome c-type biogenesis protein CcmH/NrfF